MTDSRMLAGVALEKFTTDRLVTVIREGENLVNEGERILLSIETALGQLMNKDQLSYHEQQELGQLKDEHALLSGHIVDIRKFCDRGREELASRKLKT